MWHAVLTKGEISRECMLCHFNPDTGAHRGGMEYRHLICTPSGQEIRTASDLAVINMKLMPPREDGTSQVLKLFAKHTAGSPPMYNCLVDGCSYGNVKLAQLRHHLKVEHLLTLDMKGSTVNVVKPIVCDKCKCMFYTTQAFTRHRDLCNFVGGHCMAEGIQLSESTAWQGMARMRTPATNQQAQYRHPAWGTNNDN